LQRLPGMVARRRELARRYHELLAAIPDLQLPVEPAWARSNWQSYCVRLPAGCDQGRVMQAMLDEGISTRRGVMSAHREPAYRREPWRAEHRHALAISEEISDDGLILPLFGEMTDDDQVRVAAELARAITTEDRQLCP